MLNRNIKKYRLLANMSMRDMGENLGLSHQSIKKFEDGDLIPNSEKLIQIAKLFKVKITDLINDYEIPKLNYISFRKNNMNKKQQEGLEMLIADEIAKYIEVLNFANEKYSFELNNWQMSHCNYKKIEECAKTVRKKFGISDDCPIDNLIDKMEDHNFLIIKIDYDKNFDGFCEIVDNLAFIILSSKGYERNRFTLAHELGHIIFGNESVSDYNIEDICNQFASALLLPKSAMEKELGKNREVNKISLGEILLIAREYKVSIQAVIMRLYLLKYIDEYKRKSLFITLSKNGFAKKQLELVNEMPKRMVKIILQLEAKKIISREEVIKYLGVTTDEYFKSDYID